MTEMKREVKLQNWGNSKAIRITKDILKEAGIEYTEDVILEVKTEKNQITLTKKNQMTPFQKLFTEYKGEKPDAEELWDDTEPVGKETW